MIRGTDYRQALVVTSDGLRSVTWIPVRDAVLGKRVLQVWPLVQRRCAKCGLLHSLDVVACENP